MNYVLRSFKSKEKLSSKITKPKMWIEKSVVSFKFFIVGIFTRMQSVFSWVVKEKFNSSRLSSGWTKLILSNLNSACIKSVNAYTL